MPSQHIVLPITPGCVARFLSYLGSPVKCSLLCEWASGKGELCITNGMHAGDGTAAIFSGDASVFTFSMHCIAQAFPSPLQQSDLDVALPAGTGDEEYLKVHPPFGLQFQHLAPSELIFMLGMLQSITLVSILILDRPGVGMRSLAVVLYNLEAQLPDACRC